MGSFLSGYGATQAAQGQDSAAMADSIQGGNNLALGYAAAGDALARGRQAQGNVDLKTGQVIGAQEAGYAASGVDTQSGTPLQTMADSRVMSAYGKAIIANNAAREAWGYRVRGLQAYQQGQLGALGAANAAQNDRVQSMADYTQGTMQVAQMMAGGGPSGSAPKSLPGGLGDFNGGGSSGYA